MELVKLLTMASDAELIAMIVRWGGIALLVIAVIVIGLVALNSISQARVTSRRW